MQCRGLGIQKSFNHIGLGKQELFKLGRIGENRRTGLIFTHDGWIENRDELIESLRLPISANAEEILGSAIEKWNYDAFKKIKGALAFVGYDKNSREIIAYRDPLIAPTLSYSLNSDRIIFATDAIAHFVDNFLPRDIDKHWCAEYFSYGLGQSGNRTPFRNVKQVLPGELLVIDHGVVRRHRKPLEFGASRIQHKSIQQYEEEFSYKIRNAIKASVSDKTSSGILLSSGLDSGIAATFARECLKSQNQELKAYSWSLNNFESADETSNIASVVEFLQLDSKIYAGDGQWPLKDLENWQMDPSTPICNPFCRLKQLVLRGARDDGCETILNPVFADRLYPWPRYYLQDLLIDRKYSQLSSEISGMLARLGFGTCNSSAFRQLIKYVIGKTKRKLMPAPPYFTTLSSRYFLPAETWPGEVNNQYRSEDRQRIFSLNNAGATKYDNYYANILGIEIRDPFYNYELCEYLLSIPAYLFHKGGMQKVLVRNILKGKFPDTKRLQPRVGDLSGFFDYGFQKERQKLKSFLFSSNSSWQEFVEQSYIESAFSVENPTRQQLGAIWQCFGYQNWVNRF